MMGKLCNVDSNLDHTLQQTHTLINSLLGKQVPHVDVNGALLYVIIKLNSASVIYYHGIISF